MGKKISSNLFIRKVLEYISMNSIAKSLIMVLLTFLKKKMLNPWIILVVYDGHFFLFSLDVNFTHSNDVFTI